jgi:DNA-binding NtrC family response regulator
LSERYRLLVVDDEQHVVDSLRRTLRHEPYDVVTTTSPLKAIDLLRESDFDILISDIDMPEISGLELIAEAHRNHPAVLRVLLTGDASIESALLAINEGAVHKYLTKPWKAREIRAILRGLTEQVEALRKESASMHLARAGQIQRQALEARYLGITTVARIEGAYLLNDMRVVEELNSCEEYRTVFAAAGWLPSVSGKTEDLRRS